MRRALKFRCSCSFGDVAVFVLLLLLHKRLHFFYFFFYLFLSLSIRHLSVLRIKFNLFRLKYVWKKRYSFLFFKFYCTKNVNSQNATTSKNKKNHGSEHTGREHYQRCNSNTTKCNVTFMHPVKSHYWISLMAFWRWSDAASRVRHSKNALPKIGFSVASLSLCVWQMNQNDC